MSRHIMAIDPGDVHCGFAWVTLLNRPRLHEHTPRDGLHRCVDGTPDGRLHLWRCVTFSQQELFQYLELHLHRADVLVVERFQLYPWMARQQGFSEFKTSEAIGVIKWLAGRYAPETALRIHDAAGNKKDGRRFANEWGFSMVERKLGSGKWAYWGPDFAIPGQPHRRDAAAHAMAYLGGAGLYPDSDS